MPKPEAPPFVAVATYLKPEVARQIDQAAAREGLSRAAWVRTRIFAALREESA